MHRLDVALQYALAMLVHAANVVLRGHVTGLRGAGEIAHRRGIILGYPIAEIIEQPDVGGGIEIAHVRGAAIPHQGDREVPGSAETIFIKLPERILRHVVIAVHRHLIPAPRLGGIRRHAIAVTQQAGGGHRGLDMARLGGDQVPGQGIDRLARQTVAAIVEHRQVILRDDHALFSGEAIVMQRPLRVRSNFVASRP